MIALMMFDKILLAIKYAVAAVHDAGPVLARFMHPHLVFLPVRLGLESLLRFLLCTICAEHVWLASLTLRLVVGKQRRGMNIVGRGEAWLDLDIQRAVHV